MNTTGARARAAGFTRRKHGDTGVMPTTNLNPADAFLLQNGLIGRAVEDQLLLPIVLYKTARAADLEGRASMTSEELAHALTQV
jgi:hypothetical protein